jgi:riboflavin kinase / FMN adenylyltransferase
MVHSTVQHLNNLAEASLERPSIVTIGVFDGVHRGHRHLLSQLVDEAHRTNRNAVVLTLFPHPDVVLRGITGRYYLTTPERKAELLGELGINVVVTHPFDSAVRQIRASAFVDQLIAHLKMSSLWVTPDFAMGYQREGNFENLSRQGAEKGFEVRKIDLLHDADGERVSSTLVREALKGGFVNVATALLTRPYGVRGTVIHGDKRGRTIGFPTANLKVWDEQIIPANGVYATWATVRGVRYKAATNIGMRPTFDGQELRIEAHLLDFDQDIYGELMDLEFVHRLRGEQKFSGLDALMAQIKQDASQARTTLAN